MLPAASVYRHAAILALLVLLGAAPAAWHWNLATAPPWARSLLLGGGLLLVYVVWLLTVPHRDALWCATWVFAVAAALAVTALAAFLFTTPGQRLSLGVPPNRTLVLGWCTVLAVSMSLASMLSGRLAMRGATPPGSAIDRPHV